MTRILVAALLLMVFSGCGKPRSEGGAAGTVIGVTTMVLAPEREASFVEATGSLKAAREATIASKVMGTVTEIKKLAGESVVEGETLVVIDSRDVAGQVAQAEGSLAQARAAATLAETNYRRFEQLHARGAASALELDQARFQHETALGAVTQAQGAVTAASSYRAYVRIPAPFSGRVVDRLCEVGELAAPGRPILAIEDSRHVRLFASLEASRAPAATVGKSVGVLVPDLGEASFPGTIREVTPAADPATRSVLLKIDLDENAVLRTGLYGRVRIPLGERDVIRVPASAVVQRGSLSGVFVDVGGRAAFRLVTLADEATDRPEVLAGLSAGDVVVDSPPPTLSIGARIESRP